MIPTFVQEIIGTVVRVAVVYGSAWLAAHGGPTFTDNQLAKFMADATPVVGVLAWSIYQHYRGRQKMMTGMAAGHPLSENHVEMLIASGQAPSVLTPKHQAPTLQAQNFA